VYIPKDNHIIQEIRKQTQEIFIPTRTIITRWFNILNEEIFNNTIHPFYEIEIKRKQGCHAEHIPLEDGCGNIYATLSINENFINKNEFLYTLAHEMIHQWQWMELNQSDHGKTFWKWKSKLAQFEIPLGVSI
jgi:hypothetical protein